MPRKPANPKNDTTAKKPTRRKKTAEPVAEAPVETLEAVAETVVDTPVPKKRGRKPKTAADAVVADAPVKKTRGRKAKTETGAETIADAPAPKKRGRKAKAETTADAPEKKTRGRKKATPEIIAEPAPPVDAEAVVVEETVDIQPEMVVDVPSDEPLPGQLSFDGEVTEPVAEEVPTESVPVSEAPVKKTRKPRAKKADNTPKRRGRPPKAKAPELVLTTTLQIGETEFDISALAEKAYKEYKRVHKRKIITDFHVYVKPEEGAAYYTVNGEGAEEFKIDLT